MFDFVMRVDRAGSARPPPVVAASSMLVERASRRGPVIAAELRPPRAELDAMEGMDAWIDMYHAIRRLGRQDVPRLPHRQRRRHAGREQPPSSDRQSRPRAAARLVVPFLTSKHSLDFCLSYAEQAWQQGFPSLVVLGGDKTVGRPRCVEHAWDLRRQIREREPRSRRSAAGRIRTRQRRSRWTSCSTSASAPSST